MVFSFVSTSSLTSFVFPQVLRSQSRCFRCFASRTQTSHSRIIGSKNCASSVKHIHHCLLLHYAVSGFNRPIINSFRIFQISIDQPSTCFQSINRRLISRFHELILKLIRLIFQGRSSRELRSVWILDPF